MPGNDAAAVDDDYKDIGKALEQYSVAIAVKNMKFDESVSIETGREIISQENLRSNPSIYNVIKQIIARKSELAMTVKDGDQYPSAEVFTHSGGDMYGIKIEEITPSNYKVTLNSKVKKEDGKLVEGAIHYEIEADLENDEVCIIAGAAKISAVMKSPRALQNQVLSKFAEGIKEKENKTEQLVVMGTGSGKSFVIAGAAHAAASEKRNVIMIVPTEGDSNQLRDDIRNVQGKDAIDGSAMTLDAFARLLAEDIKGKQITLRADDVFFKQKAALVEHCMVLIDESHTHTFNNYSLAYLDLLRKNNCTLAITGTPTGKLQKMFGNEPLLDINLRTMQNEGLQRYIYPRVDHDISTEQEIVRQLVNGYFGRDDYLRPHETNPPAPDREPTGYKKPQDFLTSGEATTPEDAINKAIEHNRVRCLNQKNFIFSGDKKFREKMLGIYAAIAAGKYDGLTGLVSDIQTMRLNAEVQERVSLMKTLPYYQSKCHSDDMEFFSLAAQEAGPPKKIDLQAEILNAQKMHVANAINAFATEAFLKILGVKIHESFDDFEALAREGMLQKYLQKKWQDPKLQGHEIIDFAKLYDDAFQQKDSKYIPDGLKSIVARITKLPDPHKEQMKSKVLATLTNMMKARQGEDIATKLLQASEIDWPLDYVTSIASGDGQKWTDDQVKAASRVGCVMHVASDKKISAGYSDPNARSVQQALLSDEDELRSSENTAQLFGRVVRGKDGIAFAQQVVAKGVSSYGLDDVIANDSNRKTAIFRENEYYRKGKALVDAGHEHLFHLTKLSVHKDTPINEVTHKLTELTNTLLSEFETRENLIGVLEQHRNTPFEDAEKDRALIQEAKRQLELISVERVKLNKFFIQTINDYIKKTSTVHPGLHLHQLKFYKNLLQSRVFDDALIKFSLKVKELKNKSLSGDDRYIEAYNKAALLYAELSSLSTSYFNQHAIKDSTPEEWDEFREMCKRCIGEARPKLAKHRGVYKLLNELANFILDKMPFLHRTRFFTTQSEQALNKLEDTMELNKPGANTNG